MAELKREFYTREDTVLIAKDLIGKVLCSMVDGKLTKGIIVETEAYKAPEDKACHAHLNRFTKRTKVMFEEGGCAYIYLCYGIHHLFNIVTGKIGQAHAVLIRAVEPLVGIEHIMERRGFATKSYQLTNGPGKLTQAFSISKKLNSESLIENEKSIWIEEPTENKPFTILSSPRIGIDYAEEWKDVPWRFYVKDNKWVS